MSTTKDKDDTLLNVPSTASVIEEEEDAIVVDEHKYIIKDDCLSLSLLHYKISLIIERLQKLLYIQLKE